MRVAALMTPTPTAKELIDFPSTLIETRVCNEIPRASGLGATGDHH